MSSSIACRTKWWSQEMKKQLTQEQLDVYEEYFDRFYAYLSVFPEQNPPTMVKFDRKLIETMMDAVTDLYPKLTYKIEPFKYKVYYFLFKILPPGRLERYLLEKFIAMPKYEKKNEGKFQLEKKKSFSSKLFFYFRFIFCANNY